MSEIKYYRKNEGEHNFYFVAIKGSKALAVGHTNGRTCLTSLWRDYGENVLGHFICGSSRCEKEDDIRGWPGIVTDHIGMVLKDCNVG